MHQRLEGMGNRLGLFFRFVQLRLSGLDFFIASGQTIAFAFGQTFGMTLAVGLVIGLLLNLRNLLGGQPMRFRGAWGRLCGLLLGRVFGFSGFFCQFRCLPALHVFSLS